MDLRVLLLCFVAFYCGRAACSSSFDGSSAFDRFDSNHPKTSGSYFESDSNEFLFSEEFESDETSNVKKSANKTGTFSGNQNKLNETQFNGSNDYVNKKSTRSQEDFDLASESIADRQSSPPSITSTNNSKSQILKASKKGFKKFKIPRPIEYPTIFSGSKSENPEKLIQPHLRQNNVHYSDYSDSPKDVEVILPPEKTLFLPLINGKPKPYDGYRAPPKIDVYQIVNDGRMKESTMERERRLNLGEIIYGQPRIALSPKNLKKRSYFESDEREIQSGYDYEDSEFPFRSSFSNTEFSDDFYESNSHDFFKSFEFGMDSNSAKSKGDHSFYSEESYEASSEENEDLEETKRRLAYDLSNSYKVPVPGTHVPSEDENSANEKSSSKKDNLHAKGDHKTNENIKAFEQNLHTLTRSADRSDKLPIEVAKDSVKPKHQGAIPLNNVKGEKSQLKEDPETKHLKPLRSCDVTAGCQNAFYIKKENIPVQNSAINKPGRLVGERTKRSATDAAYIDSNRPEADRAGQNREKSFRETHFRQSKNNQRLGYKRPNRFNFQQTSKKFSNEGHSGYSGYNRYNIYNRPKTFINWSEQAKKSNSFNFKSESSKVHDGSFTYKNPERTYGVPASIYSGMFQSSEEHDEPYERIEVGELSRARNYSHRSFSSSRFEEDYSHPKDRTSTSFTESRVRPKKNAKEDRFNVDGVAETLLYSLAEDNHPVKSAERKGTQIPKHPSESIASAKEQVDEDANIKEGKINCTKEKRGEMLCAVCTHEKNSVTYEQCRYSTKTSDSEKYFAYERQKSIRTDGYGKRSDEPGPPADATTFKESENPESSHKTSVVSQKEGSNSTEQSSMRYRKQKATISHNLKRFLRKTHNGRDVTEEEEGSSYKVEEDGTQEERTGDDALTFASIGGDDFGAAFLEFGKHATEDMFHRHVDISDEEFESKDKFDFDALSFEDTMDEHASSEEDFSV